MKFVSQLLKGHGLVGVSEIWKCGTKRFWLVLMVGLSLALRLSPLACSAELTREGRSLYWDNKPIKLVGYSYYGLLGDRGFEPEVFLGNLAAHNINFTRFFLILPWPVEPGPNILPFAKTDGKYDLTRFNDEFFVRLRTLVKKAEQLGIICQVCLFDRCGLNTVDSLAWPNNPYNAACNVNGILQGEKRGYPPFCHTDGPIAEINSAFIKKVVQTIGDCNNVIYEIINEPVTQLGPLPQWHAWVARELRRNLRGRPGSRVISSTGAYNDDEIDIFSMHRAGSEGHVETAVRESKTLGKPVILSDDGDADCMFNPDVTRSAAVRALKLGQHFEHLEFTLTLQREQEKKPAAHLNRMPGLCQLNLRVLAELSTPLLPRPFVRKGSIQRKEGKFFLSAYVENMEKAVHILGEVIKDGGKTWSEIPLKVEKPLVTSSKLPAHPGARNLIRVVCIDKQTRRWPGPVYPYNTGDRWSAQLGKEVVEDGLLRIRPNHSDGLVRPAVRGNLPCYETDLRRRGKYAYFRLEDTFPRGAVGWAVTIVIEYFDEPAGSKLQLEYDGRPGSYIAAVAIPLTGSGIWKSASFKIHDAVFRGRQNNGADFRFSLRDPVASLALRSVRVQLPKDKSRGEKSNHGR